MGMGLQPAVQYDLEIKEYRFGKSEDALTFVVVDIK